MTFITNSLKRFSTGLASIAEDGPITNCGSAPTLSVGRDIIDQMSRPAFVWLIADALFSAFGPIDRDDLTDRLVVSYDGIRSAEMYRWFEI
jgi:hypothetical protein